MSTDTDTISSLQPEKATLTTKLAECNAKLLKESPVAPVAPVVAAPVVADAVGGRRRRKRGKSSKRRASKRKGRGKGRGNSSRRKRR